MSQHPENGKPAQAENKQGSPSGPQATAKKRSRLLSITIALAAILILLGAVWWVNRSMSGQSHASSRRAEARRIFGPDAAIPVVAKTAEKGNIDIYLSGLGTVTPIASVTVRTRISGQLTELHFKEGQRVKKGDLLAVIDPRPYEVALEQAQGQLMQAEAQLKQARNELQRYETLSKQDSIAAQQVDTQRALVSQYEGLAKSDQAAIDSAKLNLVYCHITAPVSGRVGLRQVDPGNYVTPGDTNGIVTLTEVQPISVIFTLPEGNFPEVAKRLHAGADMPIDVFDSSQKVKLDSGKLEAIDNQADPSTGTFKLRAVFANRDEALFPNQFVNVRMLLRVEHGSIVIPSSAIELGQDGNYVYIIGKDSRATARPVTLGPTEGEQVAVTQGLKVGDQVVVEGADRLREGSMVTIQGSGKSSHQMQNVEKISSEASGKHKWRRREKRDRS